MTVAILAGGLATRLRPITETIPKALVEVAGKPFIFHQLSYLHAQGIRKVVLCIGYLGEMIEESVGDGSKFGLEVLYVADGSKLLGTGGALRKALPHLGDAFFVLYGDSFLPIDFTLVEKAYHRNAKAALMTVLKNGDRWDKSNALYVDGALVEYNKRQPSQDMQHIDYGLGVLQARSIANWPDEVFDLADLYHNLSIGQQLAGFEVFERFYEIGSHAGLKETEAYFTEGRK
ncbi:nucleotidyl transferase [Rhizobium sp. rho-13.1]|nr:nucleotidyl transferase [Rhizobium sp. rho-13.1]TQY05594.1 nucleotidyl transferase [Rhizobium sp. rho-1.1]